MSVATIDNVSLVTFSQTQRPGMKDFQWPQEKLESTVAEVVAAAAVRLEVAAVVAMVAIVAVAIVAVVARVNSCSCKSGS